MIIVTKRYPAIKKLHKGSGYMFVLVKTTYDRKTGKEIESKAIKKVNMSEDAYYRPLVEVIGHRVIKKLEREVG